MKPGKVLLMIISAILASLLFCWLMNVKFPNPLTIWVNYIAYAGSGFLGVALYAMKFSKPKK